MSIVNVMHPDTKEVIKIDTSKVKDWKSKFLHRSGVPFEDEMETAVKKLKDLDDSDLNAIVGGSDEIVDTPEQEQESIEDLRSRYVRTTGKKLSIRYKNDRVRILNKIYEYNHQ